jgi:hypothetical protein
MKKITFIFAMLLAVSFSSCNKDEIKNLEKENFELSQRITNLENKPEPVIPSQTPTTAGEIFTVQIPTTGAAVSTVFNSRFQPGDLILLFNRRLESGTPYNYMMPFQENDDIYMNYDFNANNGTIFIGVYLYSNGSLATLQSAVTRTFQGFLIKKEAIEKNPNADLSNYNEVVKLAEMNI